MHLLVFFSTSLVVLPHLHKLALANNSQSVESKRIDIATQLFEAYSALSCCCILPSVAYHENTAGTLMSRYNPSFLSVCDC